MLQCMRLRHFILTLNPCLGFYLSKRCLQANENCNTTCARFGAPSCNHLIIPRSIEEMQSVAAQAGVTCTQYFDNYYSR